MTDPEHEEHVADHGASISEEWPTPVDPATMTPDADTGGGGGQAYAPGQTVPLASS